MPIGRRCGLASQPQLRLVAPEQFADKNEALAADSYDRRSWRWRRCGWRPARTPAALSLTSLRGALNLGSAGSGTGKTGAVSLVALLPGLQRLDARCATDTLAVLPSALQGHLHLTELRLATYGLLVLERNPWPRGLLRGALSRGLCRRVGRAWQRLFARSAGRRRSSRQRSCGTWGSLELQAWSVPHNGWLALRCTVVSVGLQLGRSSLVAWGRMRPPSICACPTAAPGRRAAPATRALQRDRTAVGSCRHVPILAVARRAHRTRY